ncbi:MAG: WD40 repeat domain-containing protein, partial [Gemmataceae bacterium]
MRTRPYLTWPATLILLALASLPLCPQSPLKADDTVRPLLVLKGHRENVFGIALTPDGKQVLTVSGDPSIKIWDAVTGKTLKTYAEGSNGHKQIILGLAVRPDGNQFLTASADNTLKVWDMPSSNALREIVVAAQPRLVAVSPDGTRLAAACSDGKLRLWNLADAKLSGELDAGPQPLTHMAFAANGQTLATLAQDGELRLYNPTGNNLLTRLAAHPGLTTGLAFAPGNNALYTTGAEGSLKTWTLPVPTPTSIVNETVGFLDTASDGSAYLFTAGKTVRLGSLTKGELRSTYAADVDLTCASASGPFVAAGTPTGHVLIWHAKESKLVGRLAAHRGAVRSVALNAAGNQLATAGQDGYVRLWTLPLLPETKIDTGGPVTAAFLSADGKQLYTASSDKTIRLLKSSGGLERQFSGHTAAVRDLTLLSDGKTLASAGDEGAIRLWGAKAQTLQQVVAHSGPIVRLAPLGERLLSAGSDGFVKAWNLNATPPPAPLAHPGNITSLAVLADGTRFITGCEDKQVRLWNMTSDKTERLFSGPTLGILSVTANRSGDRLAAGSADKSLHVWETASGKVVAKATGLSAAVRCVAFSGDNKRLLAGLADGSLKTFDPTTGKEVQTLTGHKGAITALAVTTKGDSVVSVGEDGQLLTQPIEGGAATPTKLAGPATALVLHPNGAPWAIAVGKTVQRFAPDGKALPPLELATPVRGLASSPDGTRLVLASEDGQLRIDGPDGPEEIHPHDAALVAVAFSPDGKRVLSAAADKTARHRPLSLSWQTRLPAAVRAAQPSPRGDRVAVLLANGELHWLNTADGKPVAKVTAHKNATALAYRSDAAQLATVGDQELKLWDAANPEAAPRPIPLEAAPSQVVYSSDGKRLAIAMPGAKPGTHRLAIVDTTAAQVLITYGDGESLSVNVLRWAADNRTLQFAGDDRQFRTRDVNLLAAFLAHPGGVVSLQFTPTGNLVTSGADKSLALFSPTGKREKQIAQLADVPAASTVSFDGTLVAASVGKKATVWNLADGKEVASFEAPAALGAIGFSADKQRLAVASADGRARIFDLTNKRERS